MASSSLGPRRGVGGRLSRRAARASAGPRRLGARPAEAVGALDVGVAGPLLEADEGGVLDASRSSQLHLLEGRVGPAPPPTAPPEQQPEREQDERTRRRRTEHDRERARASGRPRSGRARSPSRAASPRSRRRTRRARASGSRASAEVGVPRRDRLGGRRGGRDLGACRVAGRGLLLGHARVAPRRSACRGRGWARRHPPRARDVHLGPGVGVLAAHVVEPGLVGVLVAGGEADRDAGRQADRARHRREGAGELLAVARLVLEEEVLEGVLAVPALHLERVGEAVRRWSCRARAWSAGVGAVGDLLRRGPARSGLNPSGSSRKSSRMSLGDLVGACPSRSSGVMRGEARASPGR